MPIMDQYTKEPNVTRNSRKENDCWNKNEIIPIELREKWNWSSSMETWSYYY